MIKDTTGRSDKDVDTLSQLSDLVINVDTSIDCDKFELVLVML